MTEHLLTIEMSYTHGGKTVSRSFRRVVDGDNQEQIAQELASDMMRDLEQHRASNALTQELAHEAA